MRTAINEQLSELIGLPLFDIRHAGAMAMFQFGKKLKKKNRDGAEVELGEYSLHPQCVWRIVNSNQIVIGTDDMSVPEVEDADWHYFDAGIGRSLYEARMQSLLDATSADPPIVQGVAADEVGGFQIQLSGELVLEAFPAFSSRSEDTEHWRLLIEGRDRHFVVTGHGIE